MRHATLALLVAGAAAVVAPAAPPPPLARYHGRRRVLIVFAPAADDPRLAAQDRLLAADPAGLRERDVQVVRVAGDRAVGGDATAAAALRRAYHAPARAFAVRLIGKDGHVAIARPTPIAVPALFDAIDAMPMRRDEMRHDAMRHDAMRRAR